MQMGKESSNSNHMPDKGGVPASLLVSTVCAIIIFALSEIQNTFHMGDSFAMRSVLMSYAALGLALAFFWKRLESSPFLKLSAFVFQVGLWVSLFMASAGSFLGGGDHPVLHAQLMQQVGLGILIASGLALFIALLHVQKKGSGLILSALGAVGLIATSGAGFFVKSGGDGEISAQNAKAPSSHPSLDGGEVEEISAQSVAKAEHSEENDEHDEQAKALPKSENHEEDAGEGHAATAHEDHGPIKPANKPSKGVALTEPKDMSHDESAAPEPPHDEESGNWPHEVGIPTPVHPKPAKGGQAKLQKAPTTASLEHAFDSEKKTTKRSLAVQSKPAMPSKSGSKGSGAAWSYSGALSAEHWGELADEYRKCSVGQQQSPIDIPSSWPAMTDITLDYKLTPVAVVDNGKTIEFQVGEQNYAQIAGRRYRLIQFHIHTPSEHWMDGRAAAMEIHFVHKDEKNRLAVIGVLVEPGAEQKVLGELWNYLPQTIGVASSPRDKTFHIASILPSSSPKVYRYSGSLTTPPCSENVVWSVASEKITLSKEQISAFKARYKMNARPIQKRGALAH
jgi:carbonic anhydrase